MGYIDFNDFIANIGRGDVFLMHGNIDTHQKHYQVILNQKLDNLDKFVYLSIATSQIEKKEHYVQTRGFDPKTLVIVEIGEVSFLNKRSCFNCNSVDTYSIFEFYDEYSKEIITKKGKLPENIISKILEGIRMSTAISDKIKKDLGLI